MAKNEVTNTEASKNEAEPKEAQPQSLTGSGDTRIKVQANVSIFELSAGQVSELQRTPEVERAIAANLLKTV